MDYSRAGRRGIDFMDTEKKIAHHPAENFVVYSVIVWQLVVFPLSDWVASFSIGVIERAGVVYFLMIVILEMVWFIIVYYILRRWLSNPAKEVINEPENDNKDDE